MIKWFVIGTESLTVEQEKSFIEYLEGKRLGWWHWLPNFWLITGDNAPESSAIRDKLNDLASGKHLLVVEVNPVTWAGFGPGTAERNMFNWLNRMWKRRDAES